MEWVDMEKLNEALTHAVRSEHWKPIETYLKINKDIVENQLFNSDIVNKQTNVAVVLIKMRSVFQLLLDLPEKLEQDYSIDKLNNELERLTDEWVKEMEW